MVLALSSATHKFNGFKFKKKIQPSINGPVHLDERQTSGLETNKESLFVHGLDWLLGGAPPIVLTKEWWKLVLSWVFSYILYVVHVFYTTLILQWGQLILK